jgi:hypothetical protein
LYLPADDEEYLKFERFLRFDSFDPGEDWLNLRAVMLPNTAIFDGIPSANNFDPLLTGRYTRWMDYLADAAPALRPHLLDLMDVAVEQRLDPGEPYGVRFERLERDGRVRWIPCALPVTDAESAWNAVVAGDVDFDVQVVLELEDGAVLADELGDCSTNAPGAGPPQVLELGPNHLEIRMDAPTAGWLLLSDSWYPGWRASVDGRRVQILPANYLFRAVPLEAGEHVVVFQYQPISFWLGLVISLVAVGVWAVALRRGRNSGERTLYEK